MKTTSPLLTIPIIAVCMLLTACVVDNASLKKGGDPALIETTTNLSPKSSFSFEVYCDFRCPFCARFFTTLLAGARYEDKELIYVFKHYPFHSGSETLASFYEAAVLNYPNERDDLIESLYRFRPPSFLFETQEDAEKKIQQLITALSIAHGFDLQLIKRDMEARDVALNISESKRSAIEHGVNKTPTVFYLGKELTLREPEELARFILKETPLQNTDPPSSPVDSCSSCKSPRSSK